MKLVIYSTCRPINLWQQMLHETALHVACTGGRSAAYAVGCCLFVYLFMCLFFLFRDWFGPLSCDDRWLLKCSVSLVSGLARPRIWMIFWPLNYICDVCMHNAHSGYLECVKALIKAKGDMCLFSAVGVFTRRALLSLLLCFCLRSYLPSCLWVGVCIASFC